MKKASFQVAQGLEVLIPKSGKAYPIPCDEWAILKDKLHRRTDEPWLFRAIGSALLGACLSTVVIIITGTFQLPAQQRQHDIAWGVVVITIFSSVICFIFSEMQRRLHKERVSDVIAQMDLIEKRYEQTSITQQFFDSYVYSKEGKAFKQVEK